MRHILVSSKALADDTRLAGASSADFTALAKKYSTDSSKDIGGKLTIQKGPDGSAVRENRARAQGQRDLEAGQDSASVGTSSSGSGWWSKEKTTPLASVKKTIHDTLVGQMCSDVVTKWLEDLKQEYANKIEYETGFAPPATSPARYHRDRLTLEQGARRPPAADRAAKRQVPSGRGPDRPQDIVPHTVEEADQVADAAMADDDEKLVDELGDPPHQMFFLSLLLSEREAAGDLEVVARGVHDKLVRRHPHIFESRGDSGLWWRRSKHRWEELKTEREGERGRLPRCARVPAGAALCSKGAAAGGLDRLCLSRCSMCVWPASAMSSDELGAELHRSGDAATGDGAGREV